MTPTIRAATALICNLAFENRLLQGMTTSGLRYQVITDIGVRPKRVFKVHTFSLAGISLEMEHGSQYKIWSDGDVTFSSTQILNDEVRFEKLYFHGLGSTYVTGEQSNGKFIVEVRDSYRVWVTDMEDTTRRFEYLIERA